MSLIVELKHTIPTEILNEAHLIYKKMNTTLSRGEKRFLKYLFCVYNAYINMNKVVDVRFLARKMKIEQRKISESFTICSPIRTGYNFKKVRFSVIQYVPYYLDELQIDYISKVKIIDVLNAVFAYPVSKEFRKKYSNQTISIAFILLCLGLLDLPEDKLKKIIYRKTSTIENMVKTVKKYSNLVIDAIYEKIDEWVGGEDNEDEVEEIVDKITESALHAFFGFCIVDKYEDVNEVAQAFIDYHLSDLANVTRWREVMEKYGIEYAKIINCGESSKIMKKICL